MRQSEYNAAQNFKNNPKRTPFFQVQETIKDALCSLPDPDHDDKSSVIPSADVPATSATNAASAASTTPRGIKRPLSDPPTPSHLDDLLCQYADDVASYFDSGGGAPAIAN